jgi:uncharacterized protein
MKCPKCNVTLAITERQGVEIDYCPECRGVWLDRGELDKIIDRSAELQSGKHRDDDKGKHRDDDKGKFRDFERYDDDRRKDYDQHHEYGKYGDGHRQHKKKSFLNDLFDFD